MERTLVLLKPDCVRRRLVGRVLARFEDKGLNIAANLWVYDPLVIYNVIFEVVPSLATSWWYRSSAHYPTGLR